MEPPDEPTECRPILLPTAATTAVMPAAAVRIFNHSTTGPHTLAPFGGHAQGLDEARAVITAAHKTYDNRNHLVSYAASYDHKVGVPVVRVPLIARNKVGDDLPGPWAAPPSRHPAVYPTSTASPPARDTGDGRRAN